MLTLSHFEVDALLLTFTAMLAFASYAVVVKALFPQRIGSHRKTTGDERPNTIPWVNRARQRRNVMCRRQRADVTAMVCLLVVAATAYASYFVLRYGGLWTENDSATFSAASMHTISSGSVMFPGQYPHGFGYSAWLCAAAVVTGLPPSTVNGIVAPFCGIGFLVFGGLVAYRALLHSIRSAAAAVLFLLASPDLMFSVLRGNHEKLNILLVLTSVFCMVKASGNKARCGTASRWKWTAVFLVLSLANATVHDYFAATFSFGCTVSTCLLFLVVKRSRTPEGKGSRPSMPPSSYTKAFPWHFAASTALSWAILLFVMFIIFPPEGRDFILAETVLRQLGTMLTSLKVASNPYAAPSAQWINPVVLASVSTFRWLLLIGSFLGWIRMSWLILDSRAKASVGDVLLTSLYYAFAVLVGFSIPIDFSGVYFGTNFELRNFTVFALVASPLLAYALRTGVSERCRYLWAQKERMPRHSLRWTNKCWVRLCGLAMAVLLVVGLLKTTLEPVVSNEWMFYSRSEREALTAFIQHTSHQHLWSGPDNRLPNVAENLIAANPHESEVDGFKIRQNEHFLLFSPQLYASLIAQKRKVPDYVRSDRVLVIGSSAVYATRQLSSRRHKR